VFLRGVQPLALIFGRKLRNDLVVLKAEIVVPARQSNTPRDIGKVSQRPIIEARPLERFDIGLAVTLLAVVDPIADDKSNALANTRQPCAELLPLVEGEFVTKVDASFTDRELVVLNG